MGDGCLAGTRGGKISSTDSKIKVPHVAGDFGSLRNLFYHLLFLKQPNKFVSNDRTNLSQATEKNKKMSFYAYTNANKFVLLRDFYMLWNINNE